MASSGRGKKDSLVDQLFREPYRFDFFQAVRVLEALGRENEGAEKAKLGPVGQDFAPHKEAVRFRSLPSRSFPTGTVTAAKQLQKQRKNSTFTRELTVSFMGLMGPGGVLPEHYTDLLLQRLRINDHSLNDFFDLFNHRTISLFYRSWLKYRFPFNYASSDSGKDSFTLVLKSLVGIGGDHLSNKSNISDDTLLLFGGRFASGARPAEGLADLLSDYLGVKVSVEQFRGHWLTVSEEERTVLPGGPERSGFYNRLGIDAIIGNRVWDVQSRFRLRVGPVKRDTFNALLPTGSELSKLITIARSYVGTELDFDVQLVLEAGEVGASQIRSSGTSGASLGWNSWLSGPQCEDRDDVCFQPTENHFRNA